MISELAAFHFIRPWALVLLLPALCLWWLQRRRRDTTQRWRRVIDPGLLRHLVVTPPRASRTSPSHLLLCGWTLAIIAFGGPTWRLEPSPFADAPPPAVIVMRVTPSMSTADLSPSRLERAKQKVADLLALREGAANGLIAYSGSAHLVLPPTNDADVVLTMARALSPEIMPRDGDHLAEAIALADRVLTDDPRGGSIVLLADTVTPDQVPALQSWRAKHSRSVVWLVMAPPSRAEADASVQRAAAALDATLLTVMPDRDDATSIARRLARADRLGDVAGQGARWLDFGYWLTPFLAILLLAGFRRGWVVFT